MRGDELRWNLRFFYTFLFTFFLFPNPSQAETSHAVLQMLSASTMGMLEGRQARQDEYPESLHILAYNSDPSYPSEGLAKCSAVAFGKCLITAAHCFEKGQLNFDVRREGFRSKVDKSSIRLFRSGTEPLAGEDLAVARLEDIPKSFLSPEDLARPGDLVLPSIPEKLTPETIRKSGVIGTVAGVGMDYNDKEAERAVRDSSYSEEEGAARLGNLLKKHEDITNPIFQIGTVKVMGRVHEFIGRDILAKIKDAEDKMNSASSFQKWWYKTKFENARKEMAEAREKLQKYQSLVMMAYPSRLQPGDSGSPVFINSARGRVVVGIYASKPDPDRILRRSGDFDFIEQVAAGRGGLATPIDSRHDWLMQQWKDLKCSP
jgi:hypothetical protein